MLRSSGAEEHDALRFAGENRHVVDYLSEAVLEQLDGELREFLLSTSIADRLCTSLCAAITDRPATGMLEEIERSNLFLIPLDDTRTWYRYHHLFGQMLRSELARRDPALVTGLHRRAATWFRSSGLVSEAIEHATAAGDYGVAADLISEHWLEADAGDRRPRCGAGWTRSTPTSCASTRILVSSAP
jgi:LuxR family maltose regulon positive regulatory protein